MPCIRKTLRHWLMLSKGKRKWIFREGLGTVRAPLERASQQFYFISGLKYFRGRGAGDLGLELDGQTLFFKQSLFNNDVITSRSGKIITSCRHSARYMVSYVLSICVRLGTKVHQTWLVESFGFLRGASLNPEWTICRDIFHSHEVKFTSWCRR